MSNNIGVYTETQALGHYAIAVNGQNTQTFDSPSLHYQVYAGSSPKNVLSMYNAAAGRRGCRRCGLSTRSGGATTPTPFPPALRPPMPRAW